jgi:tetratricopeptide (TPR) repeat protein
MLGTILRKQGDAEGAIFEFRETIKYQNESADAYLSLGQILQQKNEPTLAAQAFAEAERLNRKKADRQAAVFAVSVGVDKIRKNDLAGAVEISRSHRTRS